MKDLTTLLGSLAVVWTLVLAIPGVRAVRADEGAEPAATEEVAEGAACEVGPANGQLLVDSLHRIQRQAIRQLAPQLAQRDTPSSIVTLDNRGFNDPRQ